MSGAGEGPDGVPTRRGRPDEGEIPATVRERCGHLAELLTDDHTRFVGNAAAVTHRLDLAGNRLTVMTCDDRFSVLFANWAASCDRHRIEVRSTTLVFPTDERARDRVESLGFVAYFDPESAFLREMRPSGRYGDLAWQGYMHHQNWVIAAVLGCGVDVLFQDADVVWRHDPIPELQARARQGVDVQVMYDGPNNRFQPIFANSGFMFLRNTSRVRDFWDDVRANHELVGYYRSQQEPMNLILAEHADRGLQVHVLDEDRFTNGHRYCGGRTAPDDPWVVHVSWTADMTTKRERYESNNLWYLDEGSTLPRGVADQQDPRGELLRRLVEVGRERDQLAGRIQAMERSTSWRLTAPLRRIARARRRR